MAKKNKYWVWWKKGLIFGILSTIISYIAGLLGAAMTFAGFFALIATDTFSWVGLGGLAILVFIFAFIVSPMIHGYLIEWVDEMKWANK